MADEFDERAANSASGADAPALLAALSAAGAGDEAREFLRKQSRLSDLQIDSLQKRDEFELSHLRFRRFGDFARAALELAGFLVVLLIVCGLGTMVWSATQDHDLVVDGFSVPDDVAKTGMTGGVLAGRVLDNLGRMQAGTYSLAQGAGSYRANDTEPVRVEIPSTGISIGELNRYLREWLGHETHVAGALVHTAKGFALTIRYGTQPGSTVEGSDLIGLIDPAAEQLYRAGRPLRYANYLAEHGRYGQADAIIVPMAGMGSARERALAYLSWGTLLAKEGDPYGEQEKSLIATQLDPTNAAAWYQVDAGAFNAGNREEALKAEETVLSLIKAGKAADLNPDQAAQLLVVLAADLAIDKGDPAGSIANCRTIVGRTDALDCSNTYMVGFEADDHDVGEARLYATLVPLRDDTGRQSPDAPFAWASVAAAQQDWAAALHWQHEAFRILGKSAAQPADFRTHLLSGLATATARAGDIAGAQAIVAKTPVDCDFCLDARAQIATARHDWAAAAYWYSRYSTRTPSLPYADTHWGEMLLAKRDVDGAIAKFESAHAKGPHFADPLEMWGEALMLQNRSDLALAKFDEADKYAPNWGRLHLEWGKALAFAGKKDESRKQFAMASTLDLSSADRANLNGWISGHG